MPTINENAVAAANAMSDIPGISRVDLNERTGAIGIICNNIDTRSYDILFGVAGYYGYRLKNIEPKINSFCINFVPQ